MAVMLLRSPKCRWFVPCILCASFQLNSFTFNCFPFSLQYAWTGDGRSGWAAGGVCVHWARPCGVLPVLAYNLNGMVSFSHWCLTWSNYCGNRRAMLCSVYGIRCDANFWANKPFEYHLLLSIGIFPNTIEHRKGYHTDCPIVSGTTQTTWKSISSHVRSSEWKFKQTGLCSITLNAIRATFYWAFSGLNQRQTRKLSEISSRSIEKEKKRLSTANGNGQTISVMTYSSMVIWRASLLFIGFLETFEKWWPIRTGAFSNMLCGIRNARRN